MIAAGKSLGPLEAEETLTTGVDFDDKVEKELKGLAERMVDTSTAHPVQHFNEIRVTPADLDASLATFRRFVA